MPKKGYKQSEEHKRKIGNTRRGRTHTKETKQKIAKSRIGKKRAPFSEEWKKNIGDATRRRFKNMSATKRKEFSRNVSKALKNKPKSIEHRKNISLGHIGISPANKGKKMPEKLRKKLYSKLAYWKGKTFPESTRQKWSEQRTGAGNPAWLGGKSSEPYGIEFNDKLKEQIRARDGYRCQCCGIHQDELKLSPNKQLWKLRIHHIDYNKKNNAPKNLISTCLPCHIKTIKTSFNNREYWTEYFQKKPIILKYAEAQNENIHKEF